MRAGPGLPRPPPPPLPAPLGRYLGPAAACRRRRPPLDGDCAARCSPVAPIQAGRNRRRTPAAIARAATRREGRRDVTRTREPPSSHPRQRAVPGSPAPARWGQPCLRSTAGAVVSRCPLPPVTPSPPTREGRRVPKQADRPPPKKNPKSRQNPVPDQAGKEAKPTGTQPRRPRRRPRAPGRARQPGRTGGFSASAPEQTQLPPLAEDTPHHRAGREAAVRGGQCP